MMSNTNYGLDVATMRAARGLLNQQQLTWADAMYALERIYKDRKAHFTAS